MSNVVRDLTESPHIVEHLGYTFIFSSDYNKGRYEDGVKEFVKKIEDKFKSLYNVGFQLELCGYFVFYSKIEKRGYLVTAPDGEVIEWQGNITFDGVIKINENFKGR